MLRLHERAESGDFRQILTDELVHEMRAKFRLAAIFHCIKGRVIRATASSPQALERSRILPQFMELAWRQAEAA